MNKCVDVEFLVSEEEFAFLREQARSAGFDKVEDFVKSLVDHHTCPTKNPKS